jgi:hypothetical protein
MGIPSPSIQEPIGPPKEGRNRRKEGRKEGFGPVGPPTFLIFWNPASGWTGLTPALCENLTKAFPGIDLDLGCMESDLWLRDNPDKVTTKNWLSFITNWLRRSSPSGDSSTMVRGLHGRLRPPGGQRLGRTAPRHPARAQGRPLRRWLAEKFPLTTSSKSVNRKS